MPLISCLECGRQVSDRAASCPDCGCPLNSPRPVPRQTVTIQKTAKKYKAGRLIGAAWLGIGVIVLIADGGPPGAIIAAMGLFVYLASRTLAWWHHA